MISGMKVRSSSYYNKDKIFPLSRSKFSSFVLRCKLCFYLEQKKGLKPIPMMPFTLNNAIDFNLKQSFDICREQKTPHKIITENGLANVIPFQHQELENWRNALTKGIQFLHTDTNFLLRGGVDDVWIDTSTEKLIIVDYKAQAKSNLEDLKPENYWSNKFHEDYKLQLSFYRYLFEKNGFKVKEIAYIVHCNAKKGVPFEDVLEFHTSLIPFETNTDNIEPNIFAIKKCLDSDEYPSPDPDCHYCANYITRKIILEKDGYVQKISKRNFFLVINGTFKKVIENIINFIKKIFRF